MRISDWSSDVCSSDLTPVSTSGGGGSSATRGPAIVTRYEGANAIIVAANADVQRKLGELIRQLDTRRPQVLVEAIVVEIGDDAAKKLGVQFLLGGKNIPFAATSYRSEEHTSELQSLMRISYAVFCLKKTKQL